MSGKKPTPQKTPTAAAVKAAANSPQQMLQAHVEKREIFEGPLPHPDQLRQYEQVLPGVAERIVKMAEEEQRVRLAVTQADSEQKASLIRIAEQESQAITRATAKGQNIGLFVTVACIACAMTCAVMGMSRWIVLGFLAVPTASYIASYIPKKTKRSE